MTQLTEWETFYVIVGSSAGALIGLQFVVLTLIAERPSSRDPQVGAAFATPSVVHFAVVLLLSALVSAPWQTIGGVAVVWGLVGLGGVLYSVVVARRMRAQTAYRPVFEDWLFHVLLPLAAYAMLAVAAYMSRSSERSALFLVGAGTLVFLFVGIHNAWDAVTYHVFTRKSPPEKEKRKH
jgi:L-asparagine transporter-like permease